MTKDITTREDLFIIVNDFYSDLLESKELSHFFEAFKNEEALEHHLNTLVDFWDNTLFYSGTYQRNAMKPHLRMNRKKGMAVSDFNLWLKLFSKAVDRNFKGQNADAIKIKALSIATVMKLKMNIY